MIKKVLITLLIVIFAIANMFFTSYAAVTVTEENLKKSLKSIEDYAQKNKTMVKTSVEDNVITIDVNKNTIKINYDLTDEPTFWSESKIEQGMSYEEFQEKLGFTSTAMLAYLIAANTQGVSFEDATTYFGEAILSEGLSNLDFSNTDDTYIIVPDDNKDSENTIIDTDNKNVIYESEFGDHVMEYVNAIFKEKKTFVDSNNYNTFEWSMEQKDVTDTSCTIVSTIKIKKDADFSNIIGYADAHNWEDDSNNTTDEELNVTDDNSFSDWDTPTEVEDNAVNNMVNETIIENTTNDVNNTVATNNSSKNNTKSKKKYPNAGLKGEFLKNTLAVIIVISIVTVFMITVKEKNKK